MTKKIREEGLKELAELAARQISPIDKLCDAKDGYVGFHKLLKGTYPSHHPEKRP